ncbi:MAG: radical SAM protein [Desulfobulbales bacterium]|nr:radical SAM protein [Desulfobulbales bacterium]
MSVVQARTVGFKPGERNVFFHILTACNLSCRHCYINPKEHGTDTVSKENLGNWLKLFRDDSKKTNVIFLGGEPTLHPALPHAVRLAKEMGYASVTVDTNGFLHHDFLDRIKPSDLDYLSFSLDGPTPEVNDMLRGAGVFATCTTNLRAAVAAGFNVSLIYTVSRHNVEHLHRIVPLLAEWQVKRFFIQVIGIRGKTVINGAENWQLTPDEWLQKIPRVAADAAAQGITTIFPKVFLQPHEKFECAGRVAENYFIFPNGRVYQCPLCEDYPINGYRIEKNRLITNTGFTETRLFSLDIPEGCVINKILQPDNLAYDARGKPLYKISCCLLKQEVGSEK